MSHKEEQVEDAEESLAMISFADPIRIEKLKNSCIESSKDTKILIQFREPNATFKGYKLQ